MSPAAQSLRPQCSGMSALRILPPSMRGSSRIYAALTVGMDVDARRNEVERTINALKGFRAVATRFDTRAYIFHGTVAVAAIRLWLRS